MRAFFRPVFLIVALLFPLGAFAQSAGMDMTDEERAQFRAEVRAYLLANPEVILEAVQIMEERQQAAQAQNDVAMVQANLAELHDTTRSWETGNPDGDITLVEFVDYRCGYCRRAHEDVKQLVESDGNIRLIIKEFPILGDASVASSRFAIAVLQLAGSDAYGAVHEALISLRGNPNEATFRQLATEVGLNADEIMTHANSASVTEVINATRALAQRLQITGTPTFVMNGEMLRGYLPLDQMRAVAASLRG